MTGTMLTRRNLLSAAPALALLPASFALSPPEPSPEEVAEGFFQALQQLDSEGRARAVKFLQSSDHKVFKALAEPVELYCAKLNALDRSGGTLERVM